MSLPVTDHNGEPAGFYRRDPHMVNSLPFDVFWEVTRRHTYYLTSWRQARDDGPATPEERILARQLLQFVNVTLEPVDPTIAAADIGLRQLAGGYQRGAVLQMTFRSIFALLLTAPSEIRAAARDLLLKTEAIDTTTGEGAGKLYSALNEGPRSSLDVLVPGMHFTLNPLASQRALVDGMTNAARAINAQLKIPASRRRLPEIAAYLDVWDQREGWMNATYDFTRERTLQEIARADGTAKSTIASRYRSGFVIITGHSYSPEKWFRIFGVIKVQQLTVAENASGQPDSTSSPERGTTASDNAPSPVPQYQGATSLWELVQRIQKRLALRASDQEIAQEVDLEDSRLVAFLRSRCADGLL